MSNYQIKVKLQYAGIKSGISDKNGVKREWRSVNFLVENNGAITTQRFFVDAFPENLKAIPLFSMCDVILSVLFSDRPKFVAAVPIPQS